MEYISGGYKYLSELYQGHNVLVYYSMTANTVSLFFSVSGVAGGMDWVERVCDLFLPQRWSSRQQQRLAQLWNGQCVLVGGRLMITV